MSCLWEHGCVVSPFLAGPTFYGDGISFFFFCVCLSSCPARVTGSLKFPGVDALVVCLFLVCVLCFSFLVPVLLRHSKSLIASLRCNSRLA